MALRSNGGGRQEAAQARHSSDCLRRIYLLHLKRWLSVHPVHCVALSVPYGRARTVRSTLADHPQAGTRSGEKTETMICQPSPGLMPGREPKAPHADHYAAAGEGRFASSTPGTRVRVGSLP